MLIALLESPRIRRAESEGDLTTRLVWQEEAKSLPFGVVWDYYCEGKGVPVGAAWLPAVQQYEQGVLSQRS